MTDRNLSLKEGGKYLVRIADEDDTIGLFRGYISLGEDLALAISSENGGMRFIPLGQVVYIDVLEDAVPAAEEPNKKFDVYYR